MPDTWHEDKGNPFQYAAHVQLDLTADDDTFRAAAKAKIDAGGLLSDWEVMRLLQVELPPEREAEIAEMANVLRRAEHHRVVRYWLWMAALFVVTNVVIILLAVLTD